MVNAKREKRELCRRVIYLGQRNKCLASLLFRGKKVVARESFSEEKEEDFVSVLSSCFCSSLLLFVSKFLRRFVTRVLLLR